MHYRPFCRTEEQRIETKPGVLHPRMNGTMELSAEVIAVNEKASENWPKEDLLGLLESMRINLPQNDLTKFKTAESHLDWGKVAFNQYTADMCKQKWFEISHEVRKFRTLSEIILDAQDHVKNPYKGKKLKKHPDFPKKPLTPYFRFFMEKRAKYAKLHPEMSNLDLTKILSMKYKELPDKKKMKYMQDFQREKEEFERNMARFREEHPDLIENFKRSDIPEKPKTPQQLWYSHERKIHLKTHPDATTKDIKEGLGKQWSQLPDKKRLKWITKSLEQQKQYEEVMRGYIQQHPELNMSQEGITKSTLTKAERQLKDKFDGRPTKPPPNGYSMYCAELMSNMKDVPSTERMVMCSRQWKLLTQKEKDGFQKRCEQRKKAYEIEMNRFLCSLSVEEQQRVLGEEKMQGFNRKGAGKPLSKKNSTSKEKYKRLEAALKAESDKKELEERGRLPESPKTAEDIWQQSVIGDYLARYRNDRAKALKAMEATWKTMEKKEKIMWIKKAAEDQKRYERELSEMRAPATVTGTGKKMKFEGEPKKPPMNGYQKFSQELLSNGELNQLPLKERMVEIGGRWQKLSQAHKDRYKKMAEEKQKQYKVQMEHWLKSLSSQDRAMYKEYTSNKRKSTAKPRGTIAKVKAVVAVKSDTEEDDDEEEEEEKADSSEEESSSDEESEEGEENEEEEEGDEEAEDKENESESSSSSSSSEETSDSDSD
ncbi:nucleolar transcription factor 1-A-like isoform X3 [Acipenser ruthenus]|uniref:nucleolar transcription factor 1-A-like isoform X3 n=1 Tax=Acipenser ruthenus TaxID=7906 RepID=UPI002740B8C1|nr:nucleolar transcription factor 1-A-like isoform X3 [Acipenser ruthenus]